MIKGFDNHTGVGMAVGVETPERFPVLFVNCFEPSWVNLCSTCKNHQHGGKVEARGSDGHGIPGLSPSTDSVCSWVRIRRLPRGRGQ